MPAINEIMKLNFLPLRSEAKLIKSTPKQDPKPIMDWIKSLSMVISSQYSPMYEVIVYEFSK